MYVGADESYKTNFSQITACYLIINKCCTDMLLIDIPINRYKGKRKPINIATAL